MRTLQVLRHAKSSWDDPGLADHDRPLAPRGNRATPAMAEYMRREGIAPDTVLCSSALRTRQTLELLGDVIGADADVHVESGLYGATVDGLLARVRSLPDTAHDVLLIGHNPSLRGLILRLAGSGQDLDRVGRKFPTAALATLGIAVDDWSGVVAGCAQLTAFVRPKDIGAPR